MKWFASQYSGLNFILVGHLFAHVLFVFETDRLTDKLHPLNGGQWIGVLSPIICELC